MIQCGKLQIRHSKFGALTWPLLNRFGFNFFETKFLFRVGGCLVTEKGNLTFLVTVCALPHTLRDSHS